MRGLGISLICLHNLLHIVYPLRECEFNYYPERVEKIFSLTSIEPWDAVALFFSFWGWYGVPVFIFFSGYGLVLKYEKKNAPLHFKPFFWRNYVKLMLLMFIPWALCFQTLFKPRAVLQLTYTINFFMPEDIIPGVFWYFGLTLQLYVLYVFFYHHRDNRWLWGVSVAMLVVAWVFSMFPPNHLQAGLRHNSPIWLPVFLFGVWFARGGNESPFMRMIEEHRIVAILLFFILWACSTVVRVIWFLSPLLALLLMIAIFHEHGKADATGQSKWGIMKGMGKGLAWLGVISSGIFVWHPVVRMYYGEGAYRHGDNHLVVTLVYFVLTIIAAAIYTPLYKKTLVKVLAWLKMDKI